MDFQNPAHLTSLASAILLFLLNTNRTLQLMPFEGIEEDNNVRDGNVMDLQMAAATDMDYVAQVALHSFRLWNVFSLLDRDLGYWVKPRSTAWFSRFLLNQYEDDRWLKMFRFSKATIFALTEYLRPVLEKENTKYCVAIPVVVRLACALFKLTQGASTLICSEFFAIGRSTVSSVLRQVVCAVNEYLRSEISWPSGQSLLQTEAAFYDLCGLPGVVGAIDMTHSAIKKPKYGSSDYYYFKTGGFSVNCQAIVASDKRFLDVFVGMPGSTIDSYVLRRSTLYRKAMQNSLWDAGVQFQGFLPYLLGDGGYPLMPWLLVPHRQHRNLLTANKLFNKTLSRSRAVVENAFALLKQTFRKLQGKSDLEICFFPDVVTACTILDNLLLRQNESDVHWLGDLPQAEGICNTSAQNVAAAPDLPNANEGIVDDTLASQKRTNLGLYLTL